MKSTILFLLAFSFTNLQLCYSQNDLAVKKERIKPFIAYEFGEAAFNRFQSLSGEIGIRFPNNHAVRLTHMNVHLTEQHLSTDFAGAVDGSNVKGRFFGFEFFYDFPVFVKGLYISPSIGYYQNEYQHTLLGQELKNKTATIGAGIGYRETDVFGLNGLYFMLTFPMRISLNPIKETQLGETIIKNNTFDNNIWFFIGYEF